MSNVPNSPLNRLPRAKAGGGFSLLSGITVLDLTTSIAGPYATMLLGDMGATVTKIERPLTGDDARAWGPPFLDGESLWFLSVNRNKESVALDIRIPEGRALLEKLVAISDVVVLNQLPSVAAKLGLDYETLRQFRSDLIYVSLTGYGLDNERQDWPCYDLIAEGYAGIMDLTGESDGPPQKIGAPAADMLAGHDAALAVAAALVARARTGAGCMIEISLVESMVRLAMPRLSSYLGSGELCRRSGGTDSVIAIYQAFDAADQPFTLALGNDRIWIRFCALLDLADFGNAPRFATNAGRREHRAEIVGHLAAIFKSKPRAEWLRLFAESGIPSGPINRVDEVAEDSFLVDRGLFFSLETEDGRLIPQIGTGIRIDGAVNVPRSAPPRLGEHNDALVSRLQGWAHDLAARTNETPA